MKLKFFPLVAAFIFAPGIVQVIKAQSFEEFVKQQNEEFERFAKERQQGIEALRNEYEQTVEDYKRAMNRMYDSEISSIDLMKSDDNIENTSKAKAPKSAINSSDLEKDAKDAKQTIANTSSSELMKQITGTTTDEANAQQVKEATNKLAAVISDVINQTVTTPKEQPKTEPKKAEKAEPEKEQKAEPKKEKEQKAEQKSEPEKEQKTEPKKEQKAEQKNEQKAETKKSETKSNNGNIPSGKPCTYSRISSPFGERIHPVYGKKSFHKGIDLAAPNGTPIYATADGVVAFAGVCNGYGNFIKLNHQNGYKTGYAHMSSMVVKTNDKVKKGDLIGYVGSTGTSTGNHLHYEVYYNDQVTDPAKTL
ncbi:MAG: peptidoglycan DD-metalloendopeptidase family protein [Salinivirgaceae bacterium]|nr:peptidoglycan DD-metalloendopeptidase family protein [Salinivirgaceae bacterium]